MSISSYQWLFISASFGSRMKMLAQKQHKHFKIMNALMIAASYQMLKESIFMMTQRPGPLTRFNREADTRSKQNVGETYRSSLAIKT